MYLTNRVLCHVKVLSFSSFFFAVILFDFGKRKNNLKRALLSAVNVYYASGSYLLDFDDDRQKIKIENAKNCKDQDKTQNANINKNGPDNEFNDNA